MGSEMCIRDRFNSATPKPPVIRKDLRDISYIGRVIADFVPNFVAMATGVGSCRICLASFNSRPRKPSAIDKALADISYVSRVIADLSQILLPWQLCLPDSPKPDSPKLGFRVRVSV